MSKVYEGYSLDQHQEGTPRKLSAPALHLNFAKELEELRIGKPWELHGHNAKTLVKYPDLRVVLIAIKAGMNLGEHQTVGQLSLQTIAGRVKLKLSGESVDLPPGSLMALGPSVSHDVEAVEESLVLLTIAWPNPHGP